jgi:hypothetical protein
MKTLLKVVAVLTLCIVALFALIVFGAKMSDADAQVTAEANAKRAAEHHRAVEKAIAAQSVMVGMTTDEVMRAWGKPRERQRSGDAAGTRELWQYSGYVIKFDNGKLVSWAEVK